MSEKKNKKPKQFLDILGTGRTLLQQSFDRFASFIDENRIYVSTNENYIDLVKEQLPDLHERQILIEPIRKNTAPCVLFATNRIASMDDDANVVISPSDHIVLDKKKFPLTQLQHSQNLSQHLNHCASLVYHQNDVKDFPKEFSKRTVNG